MLYGNLHNDILYLTYENKQSSMQSNTCTKYRLLINQKKCRPKYKQVRQKQSSITGGLNCMQENNFNNTNLVKIRYKSRYQM